MINPIKGIGDYKGADFLSYLEKIQLIHIFQSVIEAYGDNKSLLQLIVKYIVFTYSLESEHVTIKGEWGETKKRIFEFLMFPPGHYNDVVLLESEAIAEAITKWLDEQDNDVYSDLVRLKDLRKEYQRSLLLSIEKCSYDQKFTNAKHSQEVMRMIKELQNELIQNSDKLKVGVQEVRSYRKKNVIGPEKFAKHERQEENTNWGTSVSDPGTD